MSADRCPACGKELTYRLVMRDGVTRLEGVCLYCDRYKIITEEERNEWQRKGT